MSFFSKLFGNNKPVQVDKGDFKLSAPNEQPKSDAGAEPSTIINRVNEISWNDWNNNTRHVLNFPKTPIVGVTFNNVDGISRQKILAKMVQWEILDIVRDKNNPHDTNAVAVYGGMGQIGHIKADQATRIAALLDSGCTPLAKLSGLYGGDGKSYGCHADIHLLIPDSAIHLKFNVVGISGKNGEGELRTDCAESLSEGDPISISVDYDSNAATPPIIVDGPSGEFGKLNSKDAEKFREMRTSKFLHVAVVNSVSGDDKIKVGITAIFWK